VNATSSDKTTIGLRSVKGGAGTSVTAAALAIILADTYNPTTIVAASLADLAEMGSIFGTPIGAGAVAIHPRPGVRVILGSSPCVPVTGHVIVDAGTEHRSILDPAPTWADVKRTAFDTWATCEHRIIVARAEYLTLSRIVTTNAADTATGVYAVTAPGGALGVSEVEAVTGLPVVSRIDIDGTIARAVDAGVFAERLPHLQRLAVERLARNLGVLEPESVTEKS